MFTPINHASTILTIDRSRFIAYVFPLKSDEEANRIIKKLKEENIHAKHILYAYKCGLNAHSNDDHEPGAISRGFLELISQNNLDNVLFVVVRYFGGVLLGASRLLRTYLNAINDALKKVKLGEIVDIYSYSCTVDYKTFNRLKNAGYRIEKISYFDKIKLEIIAKTDILDALKSYQIEDIKIVMRKGIYECI